MNRISISIFLILCYIIFFLCYINYCFSHCEIYAFQFSLISYNFLIYYTFNNILLCITVTVFTEGIRYTYIMAKYLFTSDFRESI